MFNRSAYAMAGAAAASFTAIAAAMDSTNGRPLGLPANIALGRQLRRTSRPVRAERLYPGPLPITRKAGVLQRNARTGQVRRKLAVQRADVLPFITGRLPKADKREKANTCLRGNRGRI